MKTYLTILTATVVALSFTSCSKEIKGYENDPRVYFFERTAGVTQLQIVNRSFSFAPFPTHIKDTTLYIKVKIMGQAAPADRTFSAETVAEGTKAIAGTDYKILNGTVKANQLEGLLPVTLYRTIDLKTITKQLQLKLSNAKDFKDGATELNIFSLIWNDDYIKPDNWESSPGLKVYFGVYSVVKYKFIIEVLGRSTFPIQTGNYNPEQLTNQDMLDKKAILKAALAVYNSTHTPPLTDEFGLVVTFP